MKKLINTIIYAREPATKELVKYKLLEILKSNSINEIYIVEELEETNGKKARIPVCEIFINKFEA